MYQDIDRCISETGVDGVMSAEGILYNPSLFAARHEPSWKVAKEYFDLFLQNHTLEVSRSCLRAHLFKILHHVLQVEGYEHIRENLSTARSYEEFETVIDNIRDNLAVKNEDQSVESSTLPLPYHLSQPYFRLRNNHEKLETDTREKVERIKRMSDDTIKICETISKKQAKKMLRLQLKNERKENKKVHEEFPPCAMCSNTRGLKCIYAMCKLCCAIELKKNRNAGCIGKLIL